MISSDGKDQLLPFSKHVPSILIRQSICQISEKFMLKSNGNIDSSHEPSMERFYGALLFVDISGFTAMASKMNVDDLRTHINAYFTMIINIVVKHGGEVVKFAGDALYIVWQINREVLSIADVNECLKAALSLAVACGTEINEKCTDYRITFSQKNGNMPSPSNGTVRRVAEAPLTSLRRAAGSEADIEVIFLNVHAGVSAGLMAGLCIGASDRWEYLLLGKPLQQVALAEGQAQKGQLVICPLAHDLLHGVGKTCSCKAIPENSCFILYDGAANGKRTRIRKPEPKLQALDALADYEAQFISDLNKFTTSAYNAWVPESNNAAGRSRSATVTSSDDKINSAQSNHNSVSNNVSLSSNASVSQGYRSYLPGKIDLKGSALNLPPLPQMQSNSPILDGFIQYVKIELANVLARYVHEAARNGYHFTPPPPRYDAIISQLEKLNGKEQVSPSTRRRNALFNPFKFTRFFGSSANKAGNDESNLTMNGNGNIQQLPAMHGIRPEGSTTVPTRDGVTKRSAARKGSMEILPQTDLIAELRSVIVTFINISFAEKHELFVEDSTNPHSIFNLNSTEEHVENKINSFHFLSRSKREYECDAKLLETFQQTYCALISCLQSKGGQLRQFIIDDKGIVCIGTFGLRGSNNDDNAAAAIEACSNIRRNLQNLNVDAYTGVTSGKVYCGLVGSLTRHEYAVMGPSVNLSARLMARATLECQQDIANSLEGDRSILCDLEIQARDRVHSFGSLGTIKAKGYAAPVAIFSPQVESLKERKRRFSTRTRGSTSSLPEGECNDEDSKSLTSPSSGSNASLPKYTPGNRKRSITPSDSTSNLLGNITFGKETNTLHGRRTELQSIINFLISKVCLVEKNGQGHKVLKSLHTIKSAVIICFKGSQGIGKSSLLHNLCSVIDGVRYQNSPLNTVIVHHQLNNFFSTEMFSLWKAVLPEAFTALLYQVQKKSNKQDGLNIVDIDACLSYMRTKDMRDFNKFCIFFPLIGLHTHGTETSDNAVINITGQGLSSITAFIAYIANTLQDLIDESNCAMIFALDDLQWMDSTSWQLFKSIYQSCKGVTFITSFRPKVVTGYRPCSAMLMKAAVTPKHSNKSHHEYRHDVHGTATHKSQNVNIEEVVNNSDQNILCVTLQPLSSSAVDELLQGIYKKQFTESADLSTLSKRIFDLSGGNPLYAAELSKIAMDRIQQETMDASEDQRTSSIGQINWNSILSFQSGRIEEVIFYRFDQLDFTSQVILKAASVICAHGAFFTMQMLTFVISHSNYLNNEYASPSNTKSQGAIHAPYSADINQLSLNNSIILALQKLIEKNAFIKIVKERRKSMSSIKTDRTHNISPNPTCVSPLNKSTVSSHATNEVAVAKLAEEITLETNFLFIATVEQHTIYNIMIDDQKQLLHRCVADYYHASRTPNLHTMLPLFADKDGDHFLPLRSMTVFEYVEQARHYEKAKMYKDSMYCYYKGMTIQVEMGINENYHEHLEYLYYILQHALAQSQTKLNHSNVKTSSNHGTLIENDSMSENSNIQHSILIKQSLHFLKISLHVLLMLLKSFLFNKQDYSTVTQLSEEAHILMLTIFELLKSDQHSSNPHRTMSKVRIHTKTESNPSCYNTRESFVDIHSHHSAYDSTLIVFLHDYLSINRLDFSHDMSCTQASVISSDTQVFIATDLLYYLSSVQDIQACGILAKLYSISNKLHNVSDPVSTNKNIEEAIKFAELYSKDFSQCSLELTTVLGIDSVPYILAMIAQKILLRRDKSNETQKLVNILLPILPRLDDQSMAAAILPLVLVLIQLDRSREAWELFHVKFFSKRKADRIDYLFQHRSNVDSDNSSESWIVTKQMLEEFDLWLQLTHWYLMCGKGNGNQVPIELAEKHAEGDIIKRLIVGTMKKHPHLHVSTLRTGGCHKMHGLIGTTFHVIRAGICVALHELIKDSEKPHRNLSKIWMAAKRHLDHCHRISDEKKGQDFESLLIDPLLSLLK